MELNENCGDLLTASLKVVGCFFFSRALSKYRRKKVKKTSVERLSQSPFPVSAARFASVILKQSTCGTSSLWMTLPRIGEPK